MPVITNKNLFMPSESHQFIVYILFKEHFGYHKKNFSLNYKK